MSFKRSSRSTKQNNNEKYIYLTIQSPPYNNHHQHYSSSSHNSLPSIQYCDSFVWVNIIAISSRRRRMSLLDNLLGILRVRVKRGVNLAVRDVSSSDPYVVLKLGRQVLPLSHFLSISTNFNDCFIDSEFKFILQKLKTKVVKKNVNPQWEEDLSFTVTDPNLPLTLVNFKLNYYFLNRTGLQINTSSWFKSKNRLCTITTSSAKMTKWETQRSI